MKTVAIANPVSGRRKAAADWPVLLESLGPMYPKIDTWWTARPGHAEELAASARRSGYERVIAVGGDGTLSQVLNGLWRERHGVMPSVGTVPFGTGCDYIRNFELGRSLGEKLRTAAGKVTFPVSLGLFASQTEAGATERVFMMVLGVGFDAEVIRSFRAGRLIRHGWLAYALSALSEILRLRSHTFKGEADGVPFSSEAVFLGAGIGRYFGKGLAIAPEASPSHDRFELVLAAPANRVHLSSLLLRAYSGTHVLDSRVTTLQASRVVLRADPPALIEADGEPAGRTPLEIRIVPGAFHFAAKGVK